MKKVTRQIRKAAVDLAIPAFETFADDVLAVAAQYGLVDADRDVFVAEAMEAMISRCQKIQKDIKNDVARVPDFRMFTLAGNRKVFEAIRDLQGTGRRNVDRAIARLQDLAKRAGSYEARDTAVREAAIDFVLGR